MHLVLVQLPVTAENVNCAVSWTLEHLCAAGPDANYPALVELLASCETAAYHVSDAIGTRYFTLTSESLRSVGA